MVAIAEILTRLEAEQTRVRGIRSQKRTRTRSRRKVGRPRVTQSARLDGASPRGNGRARPVFEQKESTSARAIALPKGVSTSPEAIERYRRNSGFQKASGKGDRLLSELRRHQVKTDNDLLANMLERIHTRKNAQYKVHKKKSMAVKRQVYTGLASREEQHRVKEENRLLAVRLRQIHFRKHRVFSRAGKEKPKTRQQKQREPNQDREIDLYVSQKTKARWHNAMEKQESVQRDRQARKKRSAKKRQQKKAQHAREPILQLSLKDDEFEAYCKVADHKDAFQAGEQFTYSKPDRPAMYLAPVAKQTNRFTTIEDKISLQAQVDENLRMFHRIENAKSSIKITSPKKTGKKGGKPQPVSPLSTRPKTKREAERKLVEPKQRLAAGFENDERKLYDDFQKALGDLLVEYRLDDTSLYRQPSTQASCVANARVSSAPSETRTEVQATGLANTDLDLSRGGHQEKRKRRVRQQLLGFKESEPGTARAIDDFLATSPITSLQQLGQTTVRQSTGRRRSRRLSCTATAQGIRGLLCRRATISILDKSPLYSQQTTGTQSTKHISKERVRSLKDSHYLKQFTAYANLNTSPRIANSLEPPHENDEMGSKNSDQTIHKDSPKQNLDDQATKPADPDTAEVP